MRMKRWGVPKVGAAALVPYIVGSLLKGRPPEVGTLKRRAELSLGVGSGRLSASSGSVLDASSPIKRARLQNGDSLTLQVNSEFRFKLLAALLLPFSRMEPSWPGVW